MRRPKSRHPLQRILSERGLRHQDLARLVPISRSYLTQIINGQRIPSLPVAQRIAAVLETSVDQIFPSQRGEPPC
ncbi:helix-turn-helix transcriptional regulator [Ammonifex thiophilus]|uniref:XRE family transcriptional regulator n=1 Tax=Ammonifex thiophilus TaxID=444093 RepID=A0A3D8P1K3_9THEO|nr:XRE family transcriptional regulator [Ammonifex thiophilus]